MIFILANFSCKYINQSTRRLLDREISVCMVMRTDLDFDVGSQQCSVKAVPQQAVKEGGSHGMGQWITPPGMVRFSARCVLMHFVPEKTDKFIISLNVGIINEF